MKITTCIITLNEEDNIEECIKSVKQFSDEILIVDSGSIDNTLDIAQKLGARVLSHEWEGFVKQKQYAVEKAENDWIFSLDADERVSEDLSNKILKLKERIPEFFGYYVNRRNYYLGKWIKYGGWYPEKRLRLFHRKYANWTGDRVHEKVEMKQGFNVGDLDEDIIHYPYKNLSHHLDSINKYSDLSSEEKFSKNQNISIFQLLFKPFFKFFRDYFFKKGFLLGTEGFIHAVMGSISVFMKYAKLWEKKKNK